MKIGAIIQARMGSSRLSGKVMKLLKGKTVLEHVINRVRLSNLIDVIIVATTTLERDNIIEAESKRCGAEVFRGSEDDVLSRYYYAAKKHNLDAVVRITSDCPLIDSYVLDSIINCFLKGTFDIVSNASAEPSQRTFPRGLDVEVFTFRMLEDTFNLATEKYQREHVTPFIYEKSQLVFYYKNDVDYSKYRLTLDTEEDYQLISTIYDRLYTEYGTFNLKEIIQLFIDDPSLFNLNAHIEQKKLNNKE